MGQTKIEWTATVGPDGAISPGFTFNPWIGCQKLSPGCMNCYALDLMETRYQRVKWGPTGERKRTSDTYWKQPIRWNKQAEANGVRTKVFCASLADVFEDRPEVIPWRNDLFALIEQTPSLDWLLLTKRPQHVFDFMPGHWLAGLPANVWLGTSVENQEQADKRIPDLMAIPAKVKFLSMEPLLGPVHLHNGCHSFLSCVNHSGEENCCESYDVYGNHFHGIDWVIVGGESGSQARPMQIEWAQDIRRQCSKANIPFFMKQIGGYPDKRHDLEQFPLDLQVRQFPVLKDQP